MSTQVCRDWGGILELKFRSRKQIFCNPSARILQDNPGKFLEKMVGLNE